jgi:epoxyqueuosine reductase
MAKHRENNLSTQIVEKAKEFGACLAGIASVVGLKESPSHIIYGKLEKLEGVGTKKTGKIKPGQVSWPENARSAIVIAFEHPEERPEFDWWKDGHSGGTIGNGILMSICDKVSEWLQEEKGIRTNKLLYHIEHGGIFLKDASVMAGLGCIGKNNLLVTPAFGPRVRLRAMLTDRVLEGIGPIDFDPCDDCSMPCKKACPQEAFQGKVYSEKDFGIDRLPVRIGVYSRHRCNIQMELDIDNCKKTGVEGRDEPAKLVRYCRLCELTCPIGKTVIGVWPR